jgi:hypothetical protein
MNRNGFLPWGIALAVIVRLAYLFLTVHTLHVPIPHSGDDYHYYSMGMEVKEQGFLFKDTTSYPKDEELSYTAPLMGWYLGTIFKLFGPNWLAVIVFNLLFSILLVYVIYRIAVILSGDNRYGNLALLIAAFYAPFLYYLNSSGKEILTAFFFMLNILFIVHIEQAKRSYLSALFAALAFSLLCHLDERYIFYFPLFALFVFLIGAQTDDSKWAVTGYVAIFLICTALLFTPWFYRNKEVYQKPVLLSLRTTPFTDKLLGIKSDSLQSPVNLSEYAESYEYLSLEQLDSITVKNKEVYRKTPVTYEEYNFIKNVRKPFHYDKQQQYISNAKNLWRITNFKGDYIGTGYRFDQWSPKRNLMSLLTYGIVLLVAILTLAVFFREYRTVAWFFLLIFILHTALHVFLLGTGLTRYRYPLDGLLIVMAATGIGYAFLSKPGKRKRY